jgi:hypothetical protein
LEEYTLIIFAARWPLKPQLWTPSALTLRALRPNEVPRELAALGFVIEIGDQNFSWCVRNDDRKESWTSPSGLENNPPLDTEKHIQHPLGDGNQTGTKLEDRFDYEMYKRAIKGATQLFPLNEKMLVLKGLQLPNTIAVFGESGFEKP